MVEYRDYSVNTVVSPEFRALLLQTYPKLESNEKYLKLAAIILFSTNIDEVDGGVIMPAQLLAEIEGKQAQIKRRNYVGGKILSKFRDEVLGANTANISVWSFTENKARTIKVLWDKGIIQALEKEWEKEGPKVYLVSGKRYGAREQKKEREELVAEAASLVNNYISEAKPLIDYLNTIPLTLYRKQFDKNYKSACTLAMQIPELNKRNRNLKILHYLKKFPKPIYRPTVNGHTERIFQDEKGYLSLRRALRKELTKGWYEYDLESSQMAICAKLWNIVPVMDFLNSRKNIWEELFEWFEWDYNLKQTNPDKFDALKRPLKEALYALQFGMSKKNLEGLIFSDTEIVNNCRDPFNTFFSHPIIEAIYNARQQHVKLIEAAGQATTCFGKVIKVEKVWKRLKGRQTDSLVSNIPSILAELAQAMELKLLLPIIDMAREEAQLRRPHFSIVLWCHDGFVVHYYDKRRIPDIEQKMKDAVSAVALKAGIITRLAS